MFDAPSVGLSFAVNGFLRLLAGELPTVKVGHGRGRKEKEVVRDIRPLDTFIHTVPRPLPLYFGCVVVDIGGAAPEGI